MDTLYALVIAGGRGTRFWPMSRRDMPKQCLSIAGEEAYLLQTVNRLRPIIPEERILVVTGREMEKSVRTVLSTLPKENILVEPWGRNTAPCIGWGAVEIGRRCSGATMAVFPSDHRIGDPETLRNVVLAAAEASKSTNAFVTLGIQPTRPETGFGYLQIGPEVGSWGGQQFHAVERFSEKPDFDTASKYVAGGRHLWNAGMFVFSVDGIRDAFRSFLPRSAEALEIIQHDPTSFEEQWGSLDAISIDYGIMERSRHILTVPCEIDWSDMGTWNAAGEEMPPINGGRGVVRHIVSKDASNCVVHAPGKVVGLLGVENIVVVDTEDALLVMDVSHAQRVGEVVRSLEDADLGDHT
ncbi:MAG: mannose-1-phosphate guanylyltransferase [Myxococcota bacterium]